MASAEDAFDKHADNPSDVASRVDEVEFFVSNYLHGDEVLAFRVLRRVGFDKGRAGRWLQRRLHVSQATAYRIMGRVDIAATSYENNRGL